MHERVGLFGLILAILGLGSGLMTHAARAQLDEPLGALVRSASRAPIQHAETLARNQACFSYRDHLDPDARVPDLERLAALIPPYCLPTPAPPFAAIFRPFADQESWLPTSPDLLVCGEGFMNAAETLLGDEPYVYVASPRRLGTAFFLDYHGGSVALDAGGAVSDSTAGEVLTPQEALALFRLVCWLEGRRTEAIAHIARWVAAGATEIWVHQMLYPRRARAYIREIYYSETAMTYDTALAYTYTILGRTVASALRGAYASRGLDRR